MIQQNANPLDRRSSTTSALPIPSEGSESCSLREKLLKFCKEGQISYRGDSYRVHGRLMERSSYDRRKLLSAEILQYAEGKGFQSFKPHAFWEDCGRNYRLKEIDFQFRALHGRKELVRLNNGRYISAVAIAEITERVKDVIRTRGFLHLDDAKKILGYGRTGAVPVLEYLDAIGLTERCEGVRVFKRQALSCEAL